MGGGEDSDADGKKAGKYDDLKKLIVGIRQKYQEANGFGKSLIVAVLLVIIACLGLSAVLCVALCVGLIQAIFSSLVSMIIAAAVGYFLYQYMGAELITEHIYKKQSKELNLPKGMSASGLLESLACKFNYPFFKGIHYGEAGECVIEGKYTMYPVTFNEENVAELGYMLKPNDKKKRTVLLEAMTIRDYINKFFNPAFPIDVVKDMKKLKHAEGWCKAVAAVSAAATVLCIAIVILGSVFPDDLQRMVIPGIEVRSAYLSQYSDKVTIEKAFESFFDDCKWRADDSGDYPEVIFTGVCLYDGERADVRIVFKITGENFIVDSLDINGQRQSNIMLYSVLSAVYEDL